MESVPSLQPSDLTKIKEKYYPYLIEIKNRLVFTFVVFASSTIVGFIFYEQIIKLLISGLSLEGINIVFTSPFQFINLAINCGVATGLIVVFPLVIYQILHFLKPALKKREFRTLTKFIPFSIILFVTGFFFGALIMKWQIEIFLARSRALGIGNILDISSLLSTVILTSSLMGVGFQFPILLLLLMRIGVIKQKQLSSKRPFVYFGVFVFVLLLPVDSVLADIILTIPFIMLFETTLLLNYLRRRK